MTPAPRARLLYGDSQHCPDILYATGHHIPDPFLWFEIAGDAAVIVSPLEVSRAREALSSRAEVIGFEDARERYGAKSSSVYDQIFAISCHCGIRAWQVGADFPLALARRLAHNGICVWTADDAFFPERAVKTAQEVEHLREGVELAETGMYAAFEILGEATVEGDFLNWQQQRLTADILRGEINAAIARKGGLANHTIVAPGRYGADPHSEGAGPILANHPTVIDIFPRVVRTGYFGDLTRTVVKGTPSDIVCRAYDSVHKSRALGISMIKDGVLASNVHESVAQSMEDDGFETDAKSATPHGFFHGTGHGLGLEIHEAPRVGRNKSPLQAGNVVTVEPGLYYPEWGGMRLEDVVVIEPDGCANLTTVRTELVI